MHCFPVQYISMGVITRTALQLTEMLWDSRPSITKLNNLPSPFSTSNSLNNVTFIPTGFNYTPEYAIRNIPRQSRKARTE